MSISKIKTKSLALSSVNSDIILNNTVKLIDLNSEVSDLILTTYTTVQSESASWDSTYVTVSSLSANWQTAYSFVISNSANLTVSGTVSAKYFQGTLLDWMTLVRGYKTTPTLLATIGTGEVYTYIYSTTGADKTYYRYIATDGSEDSFYGNFTNPTLSNLIARKAIIL
jgi:hypothetical protein